MLTNEEIDDVLSNHGDNYVTIYRDLDFYYQLIAQAKEANALREQLASSKASALDKQNMSNGALITKLQRAKSMVGDMCSDGRPPKMSIPARPEVDEDLVICDAIESAITALKENE